ncbi:hypothetical protein pEaSNUABM8_00280 [Erwinia phage pEa_SNUABM_8]|nr:hypothetical protein pEaSNUABM8_00280 [Erwinia phage pEa_SNUABM_8]QVW55032.1 hypothetical protein pEaSNUABM4_00279 [Erwinia phage pEa_SNUABM_4]
MHPDFQNEPRGSKPLDCILNRQEIITRIGILAETHLMALRNTVDEEIFNSLADFPVELINNSVNGYQRFLSDISDTGNNAGAIVAGMALRFKTALAYEFGPKVLNDLKDEIFNNMTDTQYTDAFGKDGDFTLWGVANPTLEKTPVRKEFDIVSVWLFINHAKWLIVRVGAALEPEKK